MTHKDSLLNFIQFKGEKHGTKIIDLNLLIATLCAASAHTNTI